MKYIAIKELPQGQQPGEEFETTEAMGNVLVLVGAAKLADSSDSRRRYSRKDVQADGNAG